MKSLLLVLALSQWASANPWLEIFKPQTGWQAATGIEAEGKSLKLHPGDKSLVFTNATTPQKAGYLQTTKKYGDCTVETEFMVPKDSNSGIYLMGRYEVQILDSHGKKEVGYGDMGGIYRRWDDNRDPKGFDGVAPTANAAKPAGEWQKMTIKFRAPRLDADGNLLEKPVFISVELNGKTIQKNIPVNGHTRAARRTGWTTNDFIFIQGDHGPVAFRKFEVTPENFAKPK